ncbi:hypothetical protein JQC67_17070 [Aurantibacter crassamenti]|uniref:hypothetical protein n=1 Tax=Aurantibacter crassamenti TaxID=1837375 RepID=UPI001939A882|nr:hypothetical protein [Aurantibacter crassamenti]MBM1107869.1 hypothetical protein [Aurantibacter crassamenti]
MQDNKLENIFKELEGHFDTEEPATGHEFRFLEKLNKESKVVDLNKTKFNWWKTLSIAASIAVLIAVGFGIFSNTLTVEEQVAEISPEAANTQFYFANIIEEQVKQLENESTPETQQIISDTMSQLKKLELNYKNLENELLKGGNSKLILSAMITNFQTRIDLLEEVMNQIESIKTLNKFNDNLSQSVL